MKTILIAGALILGGLLLQALNGALSNRPSVDRFSGRSNASACRLVNSMGTDQANLKAMGCL